MKKIYRIKHVPTGLYFAPYNMSRWDTLGISGKLYHRKPNKSYLERVERHTNDDKPLRVEDFIIVQCEVVDIKEIQFE